MNKQYIKIVTAVALVALLSVQGMWLYNTYNLLNQNLTANLKEGFARSIEKEIYLRLDNSKRDRPEGSVVAGARPDNDFYENALAFHEYLLSWDIPLSLGKTDSIWAQKLMDDTGPVNYILLKTDAAGKTVEMINHGANENSTRTLIIEKPIRNDHSEYLRVIIELPYKIVISEMMLLLVTSLIIAIILGYCLYLQIRMILRQDRIVELRQDFIHGMVHEMKNPITNIHASANVLKDGKLDDRLHLKTHYFDLLIKEINRLLAFTSKILTVAKFENQKIDLIKSDIDLKELLNRLIQEYLINPPKEIQFTTDCEDSFILHADPEYISDVFRNLIDNAIKYSKDSVAIHISMHQNKRNTILKIRDNGIGISSKDRKRIFKKFERVQTREKDRKGGFGLGLYYVYQIVSAHGGTAEVESVPGVYSEFTLIIPNRKS